MDHYSPEKLARNLALIQQGLREIRSEIPDECQTLYLDAISQLARIEGFVKGQDDAYLRSTFRTVPSAKKPIKEAHNA